MGLDPMTVDPTTTPIDPDWTTMDPATTYPDQTTMNPIKRIQIWRQRIQQQWNWIQPITNVQKRFALANFYLDISFINHDILQLSLTTLILLIIFIIAIGSLCDPTANVLVFVAQTENKGSFTVGWRERKSKFFTVSWWKLYWIICLITLPEDNKAFSFESKFGVHTSVVLFFVSNISSRPKLKLKENTNASLPLSITSQCTNQYFAVLLWSWCTKWKEQQRSLSSFQDFQTSQRGNVPEWKLNLICWTLSYLLLYDLIYKRTFSFHFIDQWEESKRGYHIFSQPFDNFSIITLICWVC